MSERRRKSFVPPTPLTKLITAPSAPTTCYIPVPSLIHFQFVQILYSWITSSFFRAFLANWPNLRSCRPPENTLKMTNPFVQKFNLSMNRLGRKNFSSILLLIYLKAFSWLHFSDIKTLNPREKKPNSVGITLTWGKPHFTHVELSDDVLSGWLTAVITHRRQSGSNAHSVHPTSHAVHQKWHSCLHTSTQLWQMLHFARQH